MPNQGSRSKDSVSNRQYLSYSVQSRINLQEKSTVLDGLTKAEKYSFKSTMLKLCMNPREVPRKVQSLENYTKHLKEGNINRKFKN